MDWRALISRLTTTCRLSYGQGLSEEELASYCQTDPARRLNFECSNGISFASSDLGSGVVRLIFEYLCQEYLKDLKKEKINYIILYIEYNQVVL